MAHIVLAYRPDRSAGSGVLAEVEALRLDLFEPRQLTPDANHQNHVKRFTLMAASVRRI